MRRRDTLRLLAGGLAAGSAVPAAAHPTPTGTNTDGTPAPTRTDADYDPLGRVDVAGATEAVVSADGATVFVAASDGYAVVDISTPSAPTVLAERRGLRADHENGPLDGIHDVKQDGDTLLVVGPANGSPGEYLSGLLVVDVSDPAAPEHRAFYETDYPIHNCYLDGDRAYLTANGVDVRLEILDVGAEPTRLGSWALTEYDEAWADVRGPLRVLHDVWVQDDVAYVAHWDAGVWLVDVSDPAAPTVLSHIGERSAEDVIADAEARGRSEQVSLPGNAHFVTVDDEANLLAVGHEAWATADAPPDDGTEMAGETKTATGDETATTGDGATDTSETVGGGPGGIDLFDIADPSSPEKLATIDPPPTTDPTLGGMWTTAHNCELRDGVLYSSWYRGGVKRHDVRDPANPVELTWWADPPHAEFWTARAGVPGETFVGSSRGTENSPPGLYVFPD
ncbi:MAG: LVIVD repeat-containing protein, partial [Halolamina sp.]